MSKDIKLPEISYEFFIQNQDLWGSIYRLKFTPFRESGLIQEIESIARQYATEAVKLNMPNQSDTKQQEPELIPFDLEAAKSGEPLITRDGRKARFIAYVPEAKDGGRVVAFVDGVSVVVSFYDCGSYNNKCDTITDLFMAPKPMKTIYLNFHKEGTVSSFMSKEKAIEWADFSVIATAVPVQIPA